MTRAEATVPEEPADLKAKILAAIKRRQSTSGVPGLGGTNVDPRRNKQGIR